METDLLTATNTPQTYEELTASIMAKNSTMGAASSYEVYAALFMNCPFFFQLEKGLYQENADAKLCFKLSVRLPNRSPVAPVAAASAAGAAAPERPEESKHILLFYGYWNDGFKCTHIDRENPTGSSTKSTTIAKF